MVQAKARQTSHHFLLHSDLTVRRSSEEKVVPADILKKEILWVPQEPFPLQSGDRERLQNWAHQINADGSNQPRENRAFGFKSSLEM